MAIREIAQIESGYLSISLDFWAYFATIEESAANSSIDLMLQLSLMATLEECDSRTQN
ncbi:hypothetical protein IQ235_06850 [Oscillatoriales cyanobacterium LEGE 11467]|uniref:Uncharacterized protein n=1 Tax=Zarconia navalis LEGE 11467 TaxID=1828826 RepID=A0A928VUR2_9CYAN|nr:hypothetical protein [Zarconia navalis]MBE9040506.1 hypothetical protein [Zarconia navalis LEGE 11467]